MAPPASSEINVVKIKLKHKLAADIFLFLLERSLLYLLDNLARSFVSKKKRILQFILRLKISFDIFTDISTCIEEIHYYAENSLSHLLE